MAKPKSKRHTKPCVYFQTNDCPLSADECDFAHVKAPLEQYESLKNPQATHRTKPCRFFLEGQCRDGYWCRFKHPANLFAASRGPDASLLALDDVPELESDKGTDDDADVRELSGAWKAKPEDHPKYRTRPCRNFILGRCMYGDHCTYKHVLPSPSTPTNHPGLPSPSPSAISYLPTTPPHRAPASAPTDARLDESLVDIRDLDSTKFATPKRNPYDQCMHASLTCSRFSDEPATPTSPETPSNGEYMSAMRNGFRPFPLSPLSPLSYATKGPLDCSPFSPSYSVFSPTPHVPVRIVHVPFAVPLFPNVSLPTAKQHIDTTSSMSPAKTQQLRQRSFSQPAVQRDDVSRPFSQYRTKPCKFFNELGRCQKGDRCNFHTPSSPPPNPLGRRQSSTPEQEQRATSERSQTPNGTDGSNSSNNFYKINWRVVGGGVKMGTENNGPRRRSEDTSFLSQKPPIFKNPFDSIGGQPTDATSPLGPAIVLKERSRSLMTDHSASTPRRISTSKKRSSENALVLTLPQEKIKSEIYNAIIITQGDDEKLFDGQQKKEVGDEKDAPFHDEFVEETKYTFASRQDIGRAKSSPSSPVCTQHELPNMVFAAESP